MPKNKHRLIRSFVRREGRLTQGQQRALDELWPIFGIDSGDSVLDLNTVFGNGTRPKVLEIGFGNGDSLAKMAEANPQNDYLGIEVHRPGVGNLLRLIHEQGLDNIRLLNDDAVEILKQRIPATSLDRVQLFFPDPWHKRRHHKRRIVQADFVALIARKLKPGGVFHLATDWENYALHMAQVMKNAPDFENIANAGDFVPRPDYRPLTKFEQRGQRLGHGIWDLMLVVNRQ